VVALSGEHLRGKGGHGAAVFAGKPCDPCLTALELGFRTRRYINPRYLYLCLNLSGRWVSVLCYRGFIHAHTDIKFAVCLSVYLSVCLSICWGRISSETAERSLMKFCTGMGYVFDTAACILVAFTPDVPPEGEGAKMCLSLAAIILGKGSSESFF